MRKLHRSALAEIKKGRLEQAEKNLRKAIELDSLFAEAFSDLGALLMGQRRYPEAREILQQGLAAEPRSPLLLQNLGFTLFNLTEYDEAAARLREAARLRPGVGAVHLHLGVALLQTKNYAEAEHYLLLAAADPGSLRAAAQLPLGELYLATGRHEKAIDAFRLYVEMKPEAANAAEIRSLLERLERAQARRP